MSPIRWLAAHSVPWFTRLASVLTLFALAIMVYSILVPRAIPVMLAMSLGQAVGIAGFGCFFIAVVLDAAQRRTRDETPGPADEDRADSRPLDRNK